MADAPSEILEHGCSILDPVLLKYGLRRAQLVSGKSSGGPFASTTYTNGNRNLELHFRYSLGLVTYHFGPLSMTHEAYMRVLLGPNGGNMYPGFSEQPLDAFRGLANDLETKADAFLTGDSVAFGRHFEAAKKQAAVTGIARLAESES
ncbi:MAG TPA: hypothetical protein VKD70_12800 [Candidatus Acidoferrum sp.]|nr:hypothetical protein [Candidatus Acidoferrum sp.]